MVAGDAIPATHLVKPEDLPTAEEILANVQAVGEQMK